MWVVFNLFILAMLALDLGVLRRKSHEVSVKEALGWSAFWIALSLIFCGGVAYFRAPARAAEFLTGYLVEYALSVDNIFVFLVIFSYFRVAAEHRHKVLFWGIIGALVMRALLIYSGVKLIQHVEWIIYVFGLFLIYTGIKLAVQKESNLEPGETAVVRGFRKLMPVTPEYRGHKFFVMENGRRFATPLFVVLLVIETTDLMFATDSIPAILGISKDPFIVYTSNAFAVLGLRSLYFALAGIMESFHYLKYALAFILSFVGIKMLLSHSPYEIPTVASLAVIIAALLIAVAASLLRMRRAEHMADKKDSEQPVDRLMIDTRSD
jgi:tellurite resistance protein TerC